MVRAPASPSMTGPGMRLTDRHGHERRQPGQDFGSRGGLVFREAKDAFQHAPGWPRRLAGYRFGGLQNWSTSGTTSNTVFWSLPSFRSTLRR
jgi:hypothetical protein